MGHKMRHCIFFAVCFLTLLIPLEVRANCVLDLMPDADIRVLRSTKASHVTNNEDPVQGCLLKISLNDGQQLEAYTAYSFICDLSSRENIKVSFEQSCCDTGVHGDYVCGLEPAKSFLSFFKSYSQISFTLRPSAPDRRAIPDLVMGLETSELGVATVDRILEYNLLFRDDFLKLKPAFLRMYNDSGKKSIKRAALARLLRELYSDDMSVEESMELDLEILDGNRLFLNSYGLQAMERLSVQKSLSIEQYGRMVHVLGWAYLNDIPLTHPL